MRACLRAVPASLLVLLLVAAPALAAPRHVGCPVGPSGGNSTIGSWQLMTLEELAAAIAATGGDPAQADAEFAKHNRNGDRYVCTSTQVLPNDASGATTWFVSRDNIAAAR